MSAEPPSQPDAEQQLTPEQEEMLRQMEEEMRQVRVQDVLTQSVVSLINLAARRIAKEDERDLEQARIGIEAVRALLELLEPEPQREVRNALSQIQVLYAKQAGGGPGGPDAGVDDTVRQPGAPRPTVAAPPPPKLWTPGS